MENTDLAKSVRIFVDASGSVIDVRPLAVLPDDAGAVEAIAWMLKLTTFNPAKRQGANVGTCKDIEFNIH